MDNERTAVITIGDEEYTLLLTTKATKEIAGRYGQAVGLDFSAQMLEAARAKEKDHPNCHVQFVEGDALALPFPDDSFDAATSGFALRNVSDIPLAIREMARVVRPRGRLVVLEFSTPPSRVFRGMYNVYQSTVMPAIARLVSTNDGAYDYLVESIRAWPAQEELGRMIAANGWSEVEYRNLTGGIACMHRAVKPLP